ncbi:MAG: terminase small subunit [Amphritea sp.]|nr:terminase small subunit [Amphritea sp.]
MARVNKKQLADIFGVSERTLTDYQKDPTFPIEEDNGRGRENVYDTVDVHDWFVKRAAGKKAETNKERLDRIKGDREELAHAKDLGETVPADLVEERLANVVIAIRSDLLNNNLQLKTDIDLEYGIDLDIETLHAHSRTILEHLSEIGSESGRGDKSRAEEVRSAASDEFAGMGT